MAPVEARADNARSAHASVRLRPRPNMFDVLKTGIDGLDAILAGGIRPDNVAEAIARVRPIAVDLASGVEQAPGIKDHTAIAALASLEISAPSSTRATTSSSAVSTTTWPSSCPVST